MNVVDYFSQDYFGARQKFLQAIEPYGVEVESCLNDNTIGPEGEDLFADVVTIGSPSARSRLVLVSASHGVEGFCGSACQTGLLRTNKLALNTDDVSITIIHAINPHGFAWLRRVNEDNIDLNRNYVDFSKPLPVNEDYESLREAIIPADLTEASLEQANNLLAAYGKDKGFDKLQATLTKGQYHNHKGVYFGGTEASWSNLLLRRVLRERIAGAEKTILIDFHTGLGPYGYGELITEYDPESVDFNRAQEWIGEGITSTLGGDSTSAALSGTIERAFVEELPDSESLMLAIEYGTLTANHVFAATRADNWIHLFEKQNSAQWKNVKQQIRDAFYQDKDDWKEAVFLRAEDVVGRALKTLGKSE